jgi:hypothetical protein
VVLKARLKLILMADDVIVAETDDAEVWRIAFQALHGDRAAAGLDRREEAELAEWVPENERVAIRSLARDIAVDVSDLLSACHPRSVPPYIFLSRRHWEAFKRNTPERGRTAVSNAVLALTLLTLWAEKINIDRITLRDGMAVLRAISARDEHARRAAENCPWLQFSLSRVSLNPDRTSSAVAIAHAFCMMQEPQWQDGAAPSSTEPQLSP